MINADIIRGQAFTAVVPPALVQMPLNPMQAMQLQQMRFMGMPTPLSSFVFIPRGLPPPPMGPAFAAVEELPWALTQQLLHNLHNLHDPGVAMMNAQSLGIAQILASAPPRQVRFPNGTALVRELDGLGYSGRAVRFGVYLLQHGHGAVKVLLGTEQHRWMEFLPACLQLIGSIDFAGRPPRLPDIMALVDPSHPEQVELNVVDPTNHRREPVTAVPNNTADGRPIIQIIEQQIVVNGSVNGDNIAIGKNIEIVQGRHQLAKVS